MAAAKYRLDSLTAICDRNGLQLDGPVSEIMPLEPFAAKWRAFGWEIVECDGHSVEEVADALDRAAEVKDAPTLVLARTVKGKGVSFMEGRFEWHGKAPDDQQYRRAVAEVTASG